MYLHISVDLYFFIAFKILSKFEELSRLPK